MANVLFKDCVVQGQGGVSVRLPSLPCHRHFIRIYNIPDQCLGGSATAAWQAAESHNDAAFVVAERALVARLRTERAKLADKIGDK